MLLGKKKNKTEQTEVVLGTLYDANKNLVEQYEEPLTSEEINKKSDEIKNFIRKTNNKYYMLLCNDRKDYTIFTLNFVGGDVSMSNLVNILIKECLPNRGEIRSIDLTEAKDAYEIWLSIDGESYLYYLFPYDTAIIEC